MHLFLDINNFLTFFSSNGTWIIREQLLEMKMLFHNISLSEMEEQRRIKIDRSKENKN